PAPPRPAPPPAVPPALPPLPPAPPWPPLPARPPPWPAFGPSLGPSVDPSGFAASGFPPSDSTQSSSPGAQCVLEPALNRSLRPHAATLKARAKKNPTETKRRG